MRKGKQMANVYDCFDMRLIQKAVIYAALKHGAQKRKYNDSPYFLHPARVAARVAQTDMGRGNSNLIAASYLHDVVEDTDATVQDIENLFGVEVAAIVEMLTNPSKKDEHKNKNRAERKKIDREHLKTVPKEVKLIKLIDRIDNIKELDVNNSFAKLYGRESELLAEVLTGVDDELHKELVCLIQGLLGICAACGDEAKLSTYCAIENEDKILSICEACAAHAHLNGYVDYKFK